jgi:hypothetical protein
MMAWLVAALIDLIRLVAGEESDKSGVIANSFNGKCDVMRVKNH